MKSKIKGHNKCYSSYVLILELSEMTNRNHVSLSRLLIIGVVPSSEMVLLVVTYDNTD
ncbi:hypothetical protein K0M31_010322 [Melipona bicolor]|uniref:Uncharacterized protein n=1 Tax=Melipona bicolor TaxID=60889 RepID=A0AA40KII9_9HYME|nr:hypothetical protein K0M31_010322 [Melipona bicolor]